MKKYKIKAYLNASHYIITNEKKGLTHSHCFEFLLEILPNNQDDEIRFDEIDKIMESALAPYQGEVLNNVQPFDETIPTLENMCEFFYRQFLRKCSTLNVSVTFLEISETPSRSFTICNDNSWDYK